MSAALRFLAVAVVGWIGVRAVAGGMLPGAEMLSVPPSEAATVPPIVPTEFPELDPPAMPAGYAMPPAYYAQYAPAVVRVPVYRVDVGPRVSMPVGRGMRVHVDWRQRVAGSAAPGSGPALTLAADF